VNTIQRLALSAANNLANLVGWGFTPHRANHYLPAAKTLQAARQRGQSLCEYVESIWDQHGCTDRVIDEMRNAGSLTPCDRVCEIGPGTGRYLVPALQQTSPSRYEIYEIADDWATWLTRTYGPIVVRQPADGRTLRHTPSHSCGLVHAHGVFVCLPFLQAFEYFEDMCRVSGSGGHVVFDFFSDDQFDAGTISRWLASPDRYPVILPRRTVLQFYNDRGFKLVNEFENKYGRSHSRYVVLRNSASA